MKASTLIRLWNSAVQASLEAQRKQRALEQAIMKHYDITAEELQYLDTLIDSMYSGEIDISDLEAEINNLKQRRS